MASESARSAWNNGREGKERLPRIGREGFAQIREGKERLARIGREGFALLDDFCGSRPGKPMVVKPSHPPQGRQYHLHNHHQQASVYFVPDPQVFTVKQQREPVITTDQAAHRYGGRVIVDHHAN